MRERIKSLPGIVHLRKWQYDRRFFNNQRNENLFRGAYATFAEAVDSLPDSRRWDMTNPERQQCTER